MKKIVIAAIVSLGLISLSSCRKVVGNGPVVSETRSTEQFSAIDFEMHGELVYVESDENEIKIEAQQNVINVIETYVSGDELKVRVKNNTLVKSSETIRITVKGHGAHSFAVGGSGSIKVLNNLVAAQTKLAVSGSGRISVNAIETDKLEGRVSGSGSVEILGGTIGEEDVKISGSGNVDQLDADVKKVVSQTSGSGNIRLTVSDLLDVRISGSGDVYYSGSPVVNSSISGSGKLVKL